MTAVPTLDGTYRLDYDRDKRTSNGVPVRHTGIPASWWAFRSSCTTAGCAATGTQLDDGGHQLPGTSGPGSQTCCISSTDTGRPCPSRSGCSADHPAQQPCRLKPRLSCCRWPRNPTAHCAACRPKPCAAMNAMRKARCFAFPWSRPGSAMCRRR
ncbi:non-specific serine/threonine kinase domain protein [Mycobacterium xenopi 4042]|uniref:Non-specific serine/threonine kinase domain protein n=1 Tax=Mycobacterium xenopi 4042 TaxID=1299334 RepID=X7YQI0_MYCXE|nr:non-specific serine/threonine kinase domain protein [Mycobacterium xenopi 4042]